MTYKKMHGNIVYDTNDARMHASYILGCTTRKSTQNVCVMLYEVYVPTNTERTQMLTNLHTHLEQIGFCSKENSTTRRARGYPKQISFVMFTDN